MPRPTCGNCWPGTTASTSRLLGVVAAVLRGVPVEVEEGGYLRVTVPSHGQRARRYGHLVREAGSAGAVALGIPVADEGEPPQYGREGPQQWRGQATGDGPQYLVLQPVYPAGVPALVGVLRVEPHGQGAPHLDQARRSLEGGMGVRRVVEHPHTENEVHGRSLQGRRQDVALDHMYVRAVTRLTAGAEHGVAEVETDHGAGMVAHDLEVLAHPAADLQHRRARQARRIDGAALRRARVVAEHVGQRHPLVQAGVRAREPEEGEDILFSRSGLVR